MENKKQEPKEEPQKESKEEPKKESQEETIVLSKTALEQFKKEMEGLKKDRDILMQAADKRALARYYSRHETDLPKRMKVRSIDGKIVIGWGTILDKGSFQIPGTGKWIEEQKIKVIFQDGTSEDMDYITFVRGYDFVWCKRIGTTEDEKTKRLTFKLAREDNGEEILIDSSFVN